MARVIGMSANEEEGFPASLFDQSGRFLITGLSAGQPGCEEHSDCNTATKSQFHWIS